MTQPPASTSSGQVAWRSFHLGPWTDRVEVREFVQANYTPYDGNAAFLADSTARTRVLWGKAMDLIRQERRQERFEVSVDRAAGILAHDPGYLDREREIVVGLQTDAPLKRAIMPSGGLRMVEGALATYGLTIDPRIHEAYTTYRKDHNRAVFDVYSPDILACRRSGLITGLPDAYGRGRIVGDYRRVPLYGVDFLLKDKQREFAELDSAPFSEEVLRLREELAEQIQALGELKGMAARYGFDISLPAETAREAVQWLYFGYLGAIKEQNGAAMSLGRVAAFLDIYLQRDLASGTLTETDAQELIDDLVIKLRLVCFLRTPEYHELYSGDPTWVTIALGGMGIDRRTLVTRTAFRILHTLETLGAAPEPNLTVLWSPRLPRGFKEYAARLSIATSSIQYESDDLMRPFWGDDYAIACCVSAMRIGKQMQFFGARANLAKILLYAINGGVDELSGGRVAPGFDPITSTVLEYEEVLGKFRQMMAWATAVYVKALNAIHYMHDKYHYERLQMALHDRDIVRTLACGIAGLSVAADSLSAIRHARVTPIRNEKGVAVDFQVDGEYPAFGNNDDRVDGIAVFLVEEFLRNLNAQGTYRGSIPTQSLLTITSNVVYGTKTGATPDGRRAGDPFAPGANPMNGRDRSGYLAAGASIAKLPYAAARDGISWTAAAGRDVLGHTEGEQLENLVRCLDGFFRAKGFHVNVNVIDRKTLRLAMDHPELFPNLTLRVSGYAVHFVKLTREQQLDVINRTFHEHA